METTTTTTNENDLSAQLIEAARQIDAWQKLQEPPIPNEGMIRMFSGLGSSKTYRRLVDGDASQLRCDEWLPRYLGVLAMIEDQGAAAAAEDLYADITPASDAIMAVKALLRSRDISRLVLVVGETGSGKTSALRLVEKLYPGVCAFAEATEAWRKPEAALGDIVGALTGDDGGVLPQGLAVRISLAIGALKKNRRIILIDEGHHMGAEVINTLKTLINQTDCMIVVAAQATLWQKLAAKSWQEAKQLLYNRTKEVVKLGNPSRRDADMYLRRRLGIPGNGPQGWLPAVGAACQDAASRGGWAFLRKVVAHLLDLRRGGEDEMDPQALREACLAVRERTLAGR